jgi:hypothetical protein
VFGVLLLAGRGGGGELTAVRALYFLEAPVP